MIALFFKILSCLGAEQLLDGESQSGNITEQTGGSQEYFFEVQNHQQSLDLSIILTTFSDWSDPNLYVKKNSVPTEQDYDYSSLSQGSDSIIVPAQDIQENDRFNILVVCSSYCNYRITSAYASEILLLQGIPVQGTVGKEKSVIYRYDIAEGRDYDQLEVSVQRISGQFKVLVAIDQEPTSQNSFLVNRNWDGSMVCELENIPQNSKTVFIAIQGESQEAGQFSVSIYSRDAQITMQASFPIPGEVFESHYRRYRLWVDDPDAALIVTVTTFSGDPDLYISRDAQPLVGQYDYKSAGYGNETIAISKHERLQKPTGWYYIGVYGFSHSAFTIKAQMNSNRQVPLSPGVAQNGYSDKGEIDLYYLELSPQFNQNVTAIVSPQTGNPNLFAKYCIHQLSAYQCIFDPEEIQNPDQHDNIYSSRHASGDDTLKIKFDRNLCEEAKYCRIIFGVYGESQERSDFTITATTTDDAEHVLMSGRPMRMSVPKDGYRFFLYTVFNETTTNITLQLTPISGDPDLYVSTTLMPSQDLFEKRSNNGNGALDQVSFIKGEDYESLAKTYHIAVFGFTTTSFTIVAQEFQPNRNSTVVLIPGHAQRDTVYNIPRESYRLYQFSVHYTNETAQPIRVALTPITGEYAMFLANSPDHLHIEQDRFNYEWCTCASRMTSDRKYVINVPTTDHHYLPQSTYLVLVKGTNFTNNQATYSIVFSSGDGEVTLNDGVPYSDEVAKDQFKYYFFPIHFNNEDVRIKITVESGDPDLYISINDDNPHPDKENNDFQFTQYGSEVVTLVWEESLKGKCPELKDDWEFGDNTHCMLYIGVFGYQPSTYFISVSGRKHIPQQVTNDSPISGELSKSEYEYYYVYLDSINDTEIQLQPLNGDSDLFINIQNQDNGERPNDWTRPSREQSDFRSEGSTVTETVLVKSSDVHPQCGENCVAVIAVFCYDEFCSYTLQTSQKDTRRILDGQPLNGKVESNAYRYYHYYCNTIEPFMITVTPLTDGDPDLYVSKGIIQYPTKEEYKWGSVNWRGEHLIIYPSDFENPEAIKGEYVIGVFGYVGCEYSILVTNNPSPVVSLVDGQPQIGNSTTQNPSYFIFYNTLNVDIRIQLTPLSGGNSQIFVNVQSDELNDFYDKLPKPNDYRWSGYQSNSQSDILISHQDEDFCIYCNFLIGVYSDNTSNFSITISNAIKETGLESGVAKRSSLKTGEWDYYYYQIGEETDIFITVTTYSGDADVFVSTEPRPSADQSQWNSGGTSNTESIRIQRDDANFKVGKYHIGVYSFQECSYSITAHTRDSYIRLIPGWPQVYSISYSSNDDILFEIPESASKFEYTCQLKSKSSNFYPNVYVAYQPHRDNHQKPSPAFFNQKFEQRDYDQIYNQLKFKLKVSENQSGQGKYSIGIYGLDSAAHANSELAEFEFGCSQFGDIQVLGLEQTDFQILDSDNPHKRYEINLNKRGSLTVFVVPCTGNIELQISSNYTVHNQQTPDIVVSRLQDGRLSGQVSQASGKYFVTVLAKEQKMEEISFEISSIFIEQGKSPIIKPVSGGDGQIKWKIDQENLSLRWRSIEYENGQKYTGDVEYQVYGTNLDQTDLLTACNMYYSTEIGDSFLLGAFNTTQATIKVNEHWKTININVIGIIKDNNIRQALQYVPYYPIEIYIPEPFHHNGFGIFLIWGIAALLFIALALSAVFYRRYKKVQQRLEYEMSDVRNVANIRSHDLVTANLSRKYAPLTSDESS